MLREQLWVRQVQKSGGAAFRQARRKGLRRARTRRVGAAGLGRFAGGAAAGARIERHWRVVVERVQRRDHVLCEMDANGHGKDEPQQLG